MIGDVVGDPGLEILERQLPLLIKENSADFAIVNGENAAAGFGLTLPHLERIFAAGADVVTNGNHVWEKREFWPVLNSEKRVLRPMNYPEGSPGRGWVRLEKPCAHSGKPVTWLTVNLQGRELMSSIDCPFRTFDAFENEIRSPNLLGDGAPVEAKVLIGDKTPNRNKSSIGEEIPMENPVILIDFHAESSREKEALAYYLDGRVSVVAGTHTHVQTADERILPKGTAYITDLGMTGSQDGIIGMDPKICLDRARNQVLYRMEVANSGSAAGEGKTAVHGIVVEIDGETRKAISIKRISA